LRGTFWWNRPCRAFVVRSADRLVFVRRARNGEVVDTRADQVSIWRRRKKKGYESVLVELKDYDALLELFRRTNPQYSPGEHYSSRRG
jgi:hypothetical protein